MSMQRAASRLCAVLVPGRRRSRKNHIDITRRSRRIGKRFALAVGAVLSLLTVAAAPAAAQTPAPRGPVAAGGEQVCLKCHGSDQKVTAILQSPMGRKGDPHTPLGQLGCQSCHGESADHVGLKRPFPDVVFKGPNTSPITVRNQVCLSCHQAGLRINWQGSRHANNEVACTDCHTAHVRKDPVLERRTQPPVCYTCHSEQRADALKYSHHPIDEAKVTCSDCHNPHGGPGRKLLKEVTVNETCYNCHADKRGPLLWEHMPVRENCVTCHTPHGSNQPALLVQRPPYLCQQCHGNGGHQNNPMSGANLPGPNGAKTFNGTSTVITNYRAFLRGCVNCHSEIHGSNSPSGAFFTR
jgi:DmsE family decaheme c-type cytochrome